MITYPATNIFDAKFPTLEEHEEEIFYQHPIYDIKVNQLGVIYCDDSEYGIYDKKGSRIIREFKTKANCGTKLRVIWECYTGEILSSPHFLFVNANPMDTRKENLLIAARLSNKEREFYLKLKNKFVQASVDYLLKIEERMLKFGVEIEQVHEILQLPFWLTTARLKFIPSYKRKTRSSGIALINPRTTQEEADEVERLFKQGQTYYAILQRMGWNSTSRVKKVVRDRGLKR